MTDAQPLFSAPNSAGTQLHVFQITARLHQLARATQSAGPMDSRWLCHGIVRAFDKRLDNMDPNNVALHARHDARGPRGSGVVNRVDELGWLEARLREAISGSPRVTILRGEPGIGKSLLARELAGVARQSGAAVCIGRGHENLTLPYMPFVEALRARLDSMSAPERQMLSTVVDLSGLLSELLGSGSGSDGLPLQTLTNQTYAAHPGKRQLALYVGVCHALFELAKSRPTLLVLEDLHWADASSLELLSHVVFALGDRDPAARLPLMILCTSRRCPPGDRVSRLFARFAREPVCASHDLSALSEAHTLELIDTHSDARLSRQQVDAVLNTSQGNPLFALELLGALRRNARGAHGALEVPRSIALPETLHTAVAEAIEGLPATCTTTLTLASVLGERFAVELLADALLETADNIYQRLEPAIREEILVSDGNLLAFRHPLIRHVVYHRASDGERASLHLRVARVILEASPASCDSGLATQHLIAAGTAADPALVLTHGTLAGERAMSTCAWSEAARYFAAAAEAAFRVAPSDPLQRANLHFAAGLAARNDGSIELSLTQLDCAVDAFKRAGNVIDAGRVLELRTRAGSGQMAYGTVVDAQPLLDAVAQVETVDPALAGLLKEALCELYWIAGQLNEAERYGEEALQLGRELRHDLLLHHAALGVGLIRLQQLRFAEALACFEESRDAADRSGCLWLKTNALQRIPAVLMLQGRLSDAERSVRAAIDLATQQRNAAEASLAFAYFSNLALCRGELPNAESHAQSAITLMQRSSYPWGGVIALLSLAAARCLRGAYSEARSALDWLSTPGKVYSEPGQEVEFLTSVFRDLLVVLASGRHAPDAEALRERLRFYVAIVGTRDIDMVLLSPVCAMVEMAVVLEERDLLQVLFDRLQTAYASGAMSALGWVFSVPRILGAAALMLGKLDEAWSYSSAAAAGHGKKYSAVEAARAKLDLARISIARSERDAAAQLLYSAANVFSDVGAIGWRTTALELLTQLGSPRPNAPMLVQRAPSLNNRETDILRRIASGQTDAEIAEHFISEHSIIAAEVRHILSKIDVDRRSAAIAYAYEQGLLARAAVSGSVPLAIMVSDMVGFTSMVERLGDSDAQAIMRIHNGILRTCLRRHRGSEVTHTGDGFIASFVSPLEAVRCAVDIQRELASHNRGNPVAPLGVRIGISLGAPLLEEERLFGATIIAAVRICSQAQLGQVLVSSAIAQGECRDMQFVPVGEFVLKGFSDKQLLHNVSWSA